MQLDSVFLFQHNSLYNVLHYHSCPLVLDTFYYKCALSIFNMIFFGDSVSVSIAIWLAGYVKLLTITCWIYEFERAPTLSELSVGDKLLVSVHTT